MAEKNPNVSFTVLDINKAVVEIWNAARTPFYEPNLEDYLKKHLGENLFFSTDVESVIKESDIIFISVDTPP